MHPRRLLSIVEAATVTGPVKPLLMFSQTARSVERQRHSFEHHMLTTRRTYEENDALVAAVRQTSIRLRLVRERFPFDIGVVRSYARAIREIQPTIVETHDFKSHFLFYVAGRLNKEVRRIPWVAFHHGYTRMSARVHAYQQLDRISLRFANRVVTVCEPFVDQLTSRGVSADRIRVISNAIAQRDAPTKDAIDSTRKAFGIHADDFLILSVGRLSPEKGHADLLMAAEQLLGRYPNLRFLIVGDGGERERLRQSAVSLGDRVLFAGHQPDPWAFYFAADAFVLPSHSEGSPIVLLEALAAAMPIVATEVGGIPEMVTHNISALLVPARDPTKLALAIEEIIRTPRLRAHLSRHAKAAAARLSPDNYSERLWKIYDELADQR